MPSMFEEERLLQIATYVQNSFRASVQELCTAFKVSESTIRRDLRELEARNLLKRAHGGAVYIDSVKFEPTFREKEDRYREEKRNIAKKAAELIQEGDSLIIDSGTTTHYLADELIKFHSLTVVTNSILLTQKLSEHQGVEVISTGGLLRKNTMALVGPVAEEVLNKFHADKVFIGTNGVDSKYGLTTPDIVEAAVKHKMMAAADQVILLADHSKIGSISFAKFGSLSDIDICITGDGIREEQQNELESKEIRMFLVETEMNS